MNIRKLRKDEIREAQKVFQTTINYDLVHIAPYTDDGLIFRGGAMTWVYKNDAGKWYFVIWWTPRIYTEGAIAEGEQRTLIHELTHVWQGHYGTYPTDYWYGSMRDQGYNGIKDIIKKRAFRDWNEHRGRTYAYSMSNIGVNNWNDFNYEQQGSIIEDWYAFDNRTNFFGETIPGGKMSMSDPRYPFITCNILAKSVNARFIPLPQLGKGADAKIKAIQDILVSLRFLDPKFADGYMGKNTREAVRGFQKANGLKVDGDIGGPNSETRKKLGVR